jgi:pimeloyl-ACP methyl ester carboxylesterase
MALHPPFNSNNALAVMHKGVRRIFVLDSPEILIGSASHLDITISGDQAVAFHHARLRFADGAWGISRLADAAVLVNGRAVDDASLAQDDVVSIGGAQLRLVPATAADAADSDDSDSSDLFGAEDAGQDQVAPTGGAAQPPLKVILPHTDIPCVAISYSGHVWEVQLELDGLTVGSADDNDVVLDHPLIARHHARIDITSEGVYLLDLGSATGTLVNDRPKSSWKLNGAETIRIGPATLVFKPKFTPATLVDHQPTQPQQHTTTEQIHSVPKRKPIVFVPGFMGSQLWLGDKVVWPNLRTLATRTEVYMLPETSPLQVKGLVEDVVIVPNLYKQEQYSQLTDFLREGLGYKTNVDLLEFAYDWRKDLRLAARQLREQIDAWRASSADPHAKVIIMAHSMGCLVTRYYIDVLGGDAAVERVILMGGPHRGTPKIVEALLTGKGLLPFSVLDKRIRDVVATFPSVYQLLPIYPAVFNNSDSAIDIFSDARWTAEPYHTMLEDARKFRSELSPTARLPTLCIVGYGNKTVAKARVEIGASGIWETVKFIEDSEGDCTIPVSSAILDGADFHPVKQSHGALFVDNDVRFRLKLELLK